MPIRVKVAKRGKDGRPIYYGVYDNGRLALQVVRTRQEAELLANRLRAHRRMSGRH
jgi:hypothetical protein